MNIIDATRLYEKPSKPLRNLGSAILLVAVKDYQSSDLETHCTASMLLYPCTPNQQEHYDWVVSMAGTIDREWLREMLDRERKAWDVGRMARMRKHKKVV